MLDESLPQLTKAPVPVQTHTLQGHFILGTIAH